MKFFKKKWSQIPLRCGEMFVASGAWFYRDSQEWPLEEVVEQRKEKLGLLKYMEA